MDKKSTSLPGGVYIIIYRFLCFVNLFLPFFYPFFRLRASLLRSLPIISFPSPFVKSLFRDFSSKWVQSKAGKMLAAFYFYFSDIATVQ